jgi:hypothetical protein
MKRRNTPVPARQPVAIVGWCAIVERRAELQRLCASSGLEIVLPVAWAEFDQWVTQVGSAVLYVPKPCTEQIAELLRRLSSPEAEGVPLVVVHEAGALDGFTPLPRRLVRYEAMETELVGAMIQEAARAALAELRTRLSRLQLGDALRRVLMLLLVPSATARTVAKLASLAHTSESTAHRQWKGCEVAAASGLSLKHFIDYVHVVKVCLHKTHDRSWESAAGGLRRQ